MPLPQPFLPKKNLTISEAIKNSPKFQARVKKIRLKAAKKRAKKAWSN